jgi:GDP-D-mannose 3',5'-epimerase
MIGSALVKRLVSLGHHVDVADNLWRGKLEYLTDDTTGRSVIDLGSSFHQLDLAVPGALDPIIGRFDYVYHLADVVAGIGYVFRNQGAIFRQNLLINTNVVIAAAGTRPKGYLYVGTARSYPGFCKPAWTRRRLREDQYPACLTAHGWSKLMGEYEARLMKEETGIRVPSRFFTTFTGRRI